MTLEDIKLKKAKGFIQVSIRDIESPTKKKQVKEERSGVIFELDGHTYFAHTTLPDGRTSGYTVTDTLTGLAIYSAGTRKGVIQKLLDNKDYIMDLFKQPKYKMMCDNFAELKSKT